MASNRDDFSELTKRTLANRAGVRCSNPNCRKPTSGSNTDPDKSTNIGVAAHICAASPGGPRYDSKMIPKERKSLQNGIWLCQSCSKLIDSDSAHYSKEMLLGWKKLAETTSALELECSIDAKSNTDKLNTREIVKERWFTSTESHANVVFGYKPIDDFCKLTEGSVVLIAGYTGVGIDMFVQNIIRHNLKTNSQVLYFNLKESSSTIINSMLSAESCVKTADIRAALLTDEDWQKLAFAASSLEKSKLILEPYDQATSANAPYFISAITNGNADIVVLDDFDGLNIDDATTLNSFLYQMRNAAIQSGTIVFLLLDIDDYPKRIDKRPLLTDSKIKVFSKFCDVVQFVYYDDKDDYCFSNSTRILELIIAKNYSYTEVGSFYVAQLPDYSCVVQYEQTEETKKDALDKYPGMVEGVKIFADYLKEL